MIPDALKQIMAKELSQLEEIEKLVIKLEKETEHEPRAWPVEEHYRLLGEHQAKKKLAKKLRAILSRVK